MWKIYRHGSGTRIETDHRVFFLRSLFIDSLFRAADPAAFLSETLAEATLVELPDDWDSLLPPVESQEVWAAGVTYFRSREARMEESESSGADRFYDLVYDAPRPELFFKATGARVRGHEQPVRVRADSTWSVPEPELALAFNAQGKLFGYTIGNDVSARDIEGENPLYLPQAKVYRGSCALGPCLTVCDALPETTRIRLEILRGGALAFAGETDLTRLKRRADELGDWLFRENEFPNGCYLLTGTGIVPPSDFSLRSGDAVSIEISGLGTLKNTVE